MEYSEIKKRHFGNNDTNKKLTDEEIISSLEVIAATRNCDECKIRNCKWGTCNCSQITANAALDLINRQNEEIEALYRINAESEKEIYEIRKELLGKENLEESFKRSVRDFDKRLEKTVKLERVYAYKEFAERLKKETLSDRGYDILQQGTIDNLLKEMVGERRITDNQEAEKALEKMK